MDFLTSAILGGTVWDLIKSGEDIVASNLKISLKDWILDDADYEKIAEKINNSSETFRKTQKFLEAFLDDDKEITEIISRAKPNTSNQTIIGGNTFNNSPVNAGSVGTQNINYGNTDKENENNFSNNQGQINISSDNSRINAKIVKND